MTRRLSLFALLSLLPLCAIPSATSQPTDGYDRSRPEVTAFVEQIAQRRQLDAAALQKTLAQARYQALVVQLMSPSTSEAVTKNWRAYRSRFVTRDRIAQGLRFWNDHAATLERAQREFGVPAEIIVGIIGVETRYGRNMGTFRVLDTLATLAFDYPPVPNRDARTQLFRDQLEAFLVWCQQTHCEPRQILGSFAGAIGQPQFMPTSIRDYAVDYNGDGLIDLREADDAIGSVGNFLRGHGWQPGQLVAAAIAPEAGSADAIARFADGKPELSHALGELTDAGVRIAGSLKMPATTPALVVDLPSPNGTEYRVGFQNFVTLTRYNRSYFYAEAVFELAQAIASAHRNGVVMSLAPQGIETPADHAAITAPQHGKKVKGRKPAKTAGKAAVRRETRPSTDNGRRGRKQ